MHLKATSTFLTLLTLCCFSYAEEKQEKQSLFRDVNAFAMDLSEQLEDPNYFFSSYSLYSCLSLTYLGARQDTAVEMAKILHLRTTPDQLVRQIKAYESSLHIDSPSGKGYELLSANALWLDKDSYILSDYRHIAEDAYKAKVTPVDFATDPNVPSIINEWISNQTKGKIPTLLDPADISAATRMVLTSAIYFSGAFKMPFLAEKTMPGVFSLEDASKCSLPMMDQTSLLPYYENDAMQVVSLPFTADVGADDLALMIFLPKKSSLKDTEKTVTAFALQEWISSLEYRNLHIQLPKFSIKKRFSLKDLLQKMGMNIAFDAKANFSGIDGMEDLFLSDVLHAALFSLDEKGVVATAASAAVMNMKATGPSVIPPIEFFVNRPFLFAVVDVSHKSVLFWGRLADPKEDAL